MKTKGRFTMDFATNGQLFNVDAAWAKAANPEVHQAYLYRQELDLKMLKKKKEQKILSDKLWMEKQAQLNNEQT